MDKRQQIIFSAAVLIVGALAAFLFFSGQNEHKLRMQKERELSAKLAELSQKDAEILKLTEQKKDLEEQFKVKVFEMETKIKNDETNLKKYEETANSLHAEIDRMSREKEALQNAGVSHEKEIRELKKKSESLESDRKDLLSVVSRLKKDLAEARSSLEKAQSREEKAPPTVSTPRLFEMDPATNSVNLGKIVLRKSSETAARVESVDKLYQFIIISAGTRDGLRKHMVLNVLREGRYIAKVIVHKATENAAAAMIIPEWDKEDIQINDTISAITSIA